MKAEDMLDGHLGRPIRLISGLLVHCYGLKGFKPNSMPNVSPIRVVAILLGRV